MPLHPSPACLANNQKPAELQSLVKGQVCDRIISLLLEQPIMRLQGGRYLVECLFAYHAFLPPLLVHGLVGTCRKGRAF